MSRFRRIGVAAAAAAAALALAVAPGASAISINAGPGAMYSVTANSDLGVHSMTAFAMPLAGFGGPPAVVCLHRSSGLPVKYGWGIAQGTERTLLIPPFQQTNLGDGGCWFQNGDDEDKEVVVSVTFGTFNLSLTGLAPGQNPSSPRRTYNGKLWLWPLTRFSFAWSGCRVDIVGTQSADLLAVPGGPIVVDDDQHLIDVDATGVTFAITKTAGCPSTIGDSMTILQPYGGWRLNDVTVTP